MTIRQYVRDDAAFGPADIQMMSLVLNEVCEKLRINSDTTAKEVVAIRVIELTRRGEHDPTLLRDRLLAEANGGTGC